ncbi:hypothetical protein B0H14DRAFT_3587707 [Mycena olivaceomarginata]|nr:hypothetical protein B0H14DRAFT_3587707 [Mycena olivaceomarginata]
MGSFEWTGEAIGQPMDDGWARYEATDIFNTVLSLSMAFNNPESWISQANYIFARLQITSNYEDYVPSQSTPKGYLFVCPTEDFLTGTIPISFRWPACPAYWSLDPAGAERLSVEHAIQLGFPLVELSTDVWGLSWDPRVYAGLSVFQAGQGL